MSPNKSKTLLKSLVPANLGCGCGANRHNHHDVYQPKPRPKPESSSSSSNDGETSNTISLTTANSGLEDPIPNWHVDKKSTITSPKICASTCNIGESIAVVKESNDPYEDFRHSMLQMIFENEIFLAEDLNHLLQCFLRLNSPEQHHDILRAFSQVCDVVVSSSKLNKTTVHVDDHLKSPLSCESIDKV